MAFDGLVMAAAVKEFNTTLINSRIEKIYQPASGEIVLLLHAQRQKCRLVVSADARDARVHITGKTGENPLTPPLFCMVLRKHLEGGRIVSFAQKGLERVLHIHVEAIDELGRLAEKVLIHEIMGKHSNIILTNPTDNVILDGIHRYSHALSRHREVLPGRAYVPPPEQPKADPLSVTENAFRETVWQAQENQSLAKALLTCFSGISPQTCREIVARSGLAPETTAGDCGDYELQKLWQAFDGLVKDIRTGCFQPTLLLSRNGEPVAFSAIDLTMEADLSGETPAKDRSVKEHGSMNEVLDRYFTTRRQKTALDQRRNQMLQTVAYERERLARKLSIYETALADTGEAEKFKIMGEMLTANLYQLSRGAVQTEVVNYYDPAGATLVIDLDPRLSPSENAQQYFKKYTKVRNSAEFALTQIEQAQTDARYLDTVLNNLEMAETPDDLVEIRIELTDQGYLKEKPIKRRSPTGSGKKDEPLAPLEFTSSEGLAILVGRNNRQNDRLTLKIAQPEDTWLHVKDIPGAHVIIRSGHLPEVPDRTLNEAALLAAYYSKSRFSANVPVDLTLRKHVHKPKGAKPGMVIYENQRTLYVTPAEETINSLKRSR